MPSGPLGKGRGTPRPYSGPELSLAEARRVALAAQGFADRRPVGVPDRRALRRVVGRTGLFQIDSVNVLVRAHYLPAFSRLGPYPTDALDRMSTRRPRELFEYWGHEASLLPVETQPLLRWRMAQAHAQAWGRMRRIGAERPGFVESILEAVRQRGPIGAGELASDERPRRSGPWWDWNEAKVALEWLFWSGQVTSAGRRGFERLYDLPERVLPPHVLAFPTPEPADARRELLRIAARALGVATERDLRDYFRLAVAEAHTGVAELVELGELLPVSVAGWKQQAYLHREARVPRRLPARALLAPFDPLIWERDRTERLFRMRYRVEIYVPAPLRVHGYYVLPFLLGDELVARVDLKADRRNGTLLVQAAHAEDGRLPREIAEQLGEELSALAGWLGLERVAAEPVGTLGPALRQITRKPPAAIAVPDD
jgi:uncharacterized protein YcaQ